MLRLIFIVVFLVSMLFVSGQSTLPRYKQYTLRDGLSQMQVIWMFQDSRGYIWLGTKAGLNCFNGENFTSYTSKKFPEIADDHIKQICEDNSGRIWVCTNLGIFRVDGNNLKFFKLDNSFSTWMFTDSNNRVWFAKIQNSDFKVSIHYIESDSIRVLPVDLPDNK